MKYLNAHPLYLRFSANAGLILNSIFATAVLHNSNLLESLVLVLGARLSDVVAFDCGRHELVLLLTYHKSCLRVIDISKSAPQTIFVVVR
ncbi:hypothetical protein M413DRAFT_447837 [Hebeloma cylindrosporum]|uniref:Uncharacterized protein n=1 Tax=Hebeloma cylindrosporum TaxID=76867 RepID=A0A0C2YBE4_HEBCY|nr:hypothetical protein M413DRAFT_447837 [Hebeloma cylindrosporum h7]